MNTQLQPTLRYALVSRSALSTRTINVLLVALGVGFLALMAQLSFPLPGSPVPFTGQTLAVLLLGSAYGANLGVTTISLYVAAGVAGLVGVTDVRVEYAEMTQEQRSALMQRARLLASQSAPPTEVPPTTRVLAVGSGKGGVGKSSVTANLAAALADRGLTVGVLDADIWGFSIPRMLGVRGRLGGEKTGDGRGKIVPHEVAIGDGRLRVVSMGLLVDDEDTALMWRGLILAKALEQFLVDVAWGDLDYLLIDMPPGTGDIALSLSQYLPKAEVIVVTTPQPAAQKVARLSAAHGLVPGLAVQAVLHGVGSSGEGSGNGGWQGAGVRTQRRVQHRFLARGCGLLGHCGDGSICALNGHGRMAAPDRARSGHVADRDHGKGDEPRAPRAG